MSTSTSTSTSRGGEFRGAGRVDPGKTREQRQGELVTLLGDAAGRQVIERTFAGYQGAPPETCPPASLLMIRSVLQREYPGG